MSVPPREALLPRWRARARRLKTLLGALGLAARDPRVPWPTRWLILAVLAYALSPIDLVPDFIPVLGYLDDLLLVPLGIWLALRWVPPAVWAECRERAAQEGEAQRIGVYGAVAVVVLWLGSLWAVVAAWRLS